MSTVQLTMISTNQLNWKLYEMIVEEDYNGLNATTLSCYTDDINFNAKQYLGNEVFWMLQHTEGDRRFFGGIVESIESKELCVEYSKYHHFKVKTTNLFGASDNSKRSRIWMDKTVLDIIRDLYPAMDYAMDFSRCYKKHKKIDYLVQYEQSDFSFLQMICAEHGLFYFMSINNDGSDCGIQMNFADHYNSYEVHSNFFHNLILGSPTNDFMLLHTPMLNLKQVSTGLPNQFIGDDYNPLLADSSLFKRLNTQNNANDTIGPVSMFPIGGLTPEDADTNLHRLARQYTQKSQVWSFNTEDMYCSVGKVVNVKKDATIDPLPLPDTMLPIKVLHHAKDYSYFQGIHSDKILSFLGASREDVQRSGLYQNTIEALNWAFSPYLPPLDKKHLAKMPDYFIGEVIGRPDQTAPMVAAVSHEPTPVYQTENLNLGVDFLGRVRVYMPWDSNNQDKDFNKCPKLRVLTQQSGIVHLPHAGDQVLLAAVNHRSNRFVVIGSIYNSEHQPPLNIGEYAALSGIKTANIKGESPHYLYGDQTMHQERLILKSHDDFEERVGNIYDKKKATYLKSIEQSFDQFVKGDMDIEVSDKALTIAAKEGIIFDVGGSQVEILQDRVNVFGDTITLNALSGATGPLVTMSHKSQCPQRNPDESPHVGGPVISGSSNVTFAGLAAARVGDKVQCHEAVDTISQGNWAVRINGQSAAVLNSQTSHGGSIVQGVPNIAAASALALGLSFPKKDKNYDLQVQFKLMASDDYNPVITHAMLNVNTVEDPNAIFSLKSNNPNYRNHNNNPTDQLRGKTIVPDVHGGDYTLSLSPEDHELAIYNVNGQPSFPYYKSDIQIPNQANPDDKTINKSRQFDCKVLWPLMVLNCRAIGHGYEEAAATGATDEVDPLDIKYFKNNGNNVTVFVHGYNVPLGELGKEITDIKYREDPVCNEGNGDAVCSESSNDQSYISGYEHAPYNSGVWRDRNIVSHQIKKLIPATAYANPIDEDKDFNGQGAMNWFINMEKNINHAAGMNPIHPEDYDNYSRMLHVTWSGNWGGKNYGEAVDQALSIKQARRFMQALIQLKESGLEVNVIAHSLGNGFMLETMRLLAKERPDIVLDHVFMWEAAVPNNVFNRPKRKNNPYDRWDFKQALNSMKKVTVLHSLNDNILGPFPTNDKQKADIHKVYKAKPIGEWFPAYICKLFKLESLYNVAMALNVETHMVLRPEVQQLVYEYLLSHRPEVMAQATNEEDAVKEFKAGKYIPYFAAQMDCVTHTSHFHGLVQQMRDGMQQFYDDWHNPKSHMHIYLSYHPWYKDGLKALVPSIEFLYNDKVDEVLEGIDFIYECWDFIKNIVEWIGRISKVVGLFADPEVMMPLDEALEEQSELYKTIKEYMDAEPKALQKVEEAVGYYKKAKKYSKRELTTHHVLGAAYLVHMLEDKRLHDWHVPAMGYQPLNKVPRYLDKKLNYVNQTKWLYQHSGMRIPSKDMMKFVYKGSLVAKKEGMQHFGKYVIH